MQILVALMAMVGVASAGVVYPGGASLTHVATVDSALIKSDRLGGHFGYSVQEGPVVVHQVPSPVLVSTSAAVAYHQPQLVTSYVPQPLHPQQIVLAEGHQRVRRSPEPQYGRQRSFGGGSRYPGEASGLNNGVYRGVYYNGYISPRSPVG